MIRLMLDRDEAVAEESFRLFRALHARGKLDPEQISWQWSGTTLPGEGVRRAVCCACGSWLLRGRLDPSPSLSFFCSLSFAPS
jgi:hypothetical protein